MSVLTRFLILVVGTDDTVASSVKQTPGSDRYDIITADSASQALAILRYLPVHMIITRVALKDRSGLELVRHVKYIYANTVRIVVADPEDQQQILEASSDGSVHYSILTPINDLSLSIVIRQAEWHLKLQRDMASLFGEASLDRRIMALIENLEPELLERIAPQVMDLLEN